MRCPFFVRVLLNLFLTCTLAASVHRPRHSSHTPIVQNYGRDSFLHTRTHQARSKTTVSKLRQTSKHRRDMKVCSYYMTTKGCGWTSSWNCPGQAAGRQGAAGNDGTLGYECCCKQKLWQQVTKEEKKGRCEPMFAAVLTNPGSTERRSQIRKMWHSAGDGWGQLHAKFAICSPGGRQLRFLDDERWLYDDLIFLDCTEGYRNGTLTQKVVKAMESYIEQYKEYSYFMKIDDDTFISPRRLCDLFLWRRDQGKDNSAAYFGVIAEGPNETMHGAHFPNRNPESYWYEPESKFSDTVYPMSAKGGPGYILSKQVVEAILERGVAHANMLNNEDKAVGVWVDVLKKQGMDVDVVNVRGTDGYDFHSDHIVKNGSFRSYPYALHHHLSGATINCLHDIDAMPDGPEKQNATVDDCFTLS